MPYKKQEGDYPYKLARLVNCGGDLTKRWYIIYYAWNVEEQKLQRKRIYVNEYKTARDRTEEAKRLIKTINEELIAGAVIDTNPEASEAEKEEAFDLSQESILNALQYAVDLKIDAGRANTKSTYGSIWNIFKEWLIKTGVGNLPLQKVQGKHIHLFFDYLKKEHKTKTNNKVENSTYNNYRQHLSTFFNVLKDREAISKNPVLVIKKLPTEEKRNTAFNNEQKAVLKEALSVQNPQLWQFVQIIYYTLMRPGELQHLKIHNVTPGKIFIPASISKTKIARHPHITPGLQKVLSEMELDKYNPNDLLFTKKGTPGPENLKRGENAYTRVHRDILDSLGFGPEYSLYSWKHTGVVDLYRAGVKEHFIMQQGGWLDVKVFQTYMRSLGLYTNEELIMKAPEL